jgi:hypothetical protein
MAGRHFQGRRRPARLVIRFHYRPPFLGLRAYAGSRPDPDEPDPSPGNRPRLGKAAWIGVAVLLWPLTLAVMAFRNCAAFARDARLRGWQAVTTDRVLWVGVMASLILVGSFPRTAHPPENIGTVLFLACAGTLGTRWVQRRRQQKWRETGGRMTLAGPPRTEPTVAELAEQMQEQARLMQEQKARLDASDEAWKMWWEINSEPQQRPGLRIVRDDEDGRDAGLCVALPALGLERKNARDHREALRLGHA